MARVNIACHPEKSMRCRMSKIPRSNEVINSYNLSTSMHLHLPVSLPKYVSFLHKPWIKPGNSKSMRIPPCVNNVPTQNIGFSIASHVSIGCFHQHHLFRCPEPGMRAHLIRRTSLTRTSDGTALGRFPSP